MMTTTEKHGLRKKLLDACIAKQQFLIDDFKDRIKALIESDGLGNEEPYDNTDVAVNSSKVAEINTLNDHLAFANAELHALEKLKVTQEVDRSHVSPGAIVVTNHSTFFISVSVEKFMVEGHVYIGISTSSPLYQAMRQKSKGDTFTFNGISYKIKEIF
ncbi:MAG TPA: hypothetical protein VGD40_26425 [Chryseosolibacter sp.]